MVSIKSQYIQLLNQFTDQKKSVWGASNASHVASTLTSEAVNLIIKEAVLHRSSDVHIEPRPGRVIIRYRIDGILHEVLDIEETSNINIIPRIKILSNIPTDAASSKKSWDGRFALDLSGHKFDFRVATFPTLLGDKIAIRILNKNSELQDLKKIGLNTADYTRLERMILRKSGLVVVSGPTGAGKTTTLYSLIKRLHTPSVNIVTLEDPVEYQLDGINQCDLKNKGSEEFIAGLKSILRQDPDIILVGEVRDQESAEIAMRASITGHLVLTSLHANSAIGTVIRLVNMGMERHLVSYALAGVIAQRLVRRICDGCRVPYKLDSQALNRLCLQCGLDPKLFGQAAKSGNTAASTIQFVSSTESDSPVGDYTFYKGSGCNACNSTGYRGRIGIFEVLQINEELREAILNKSTVAQMEQIAQQNGCQSLAMDSIAKVKAGLVCIDDVYPILLEKSS